MDFELFEAGFDGKKSQSRNVAESQGKSEQDQE
jgi:hypothetical protein